MPRSAALMMSAMSVAEGRGGIFQHLLAIETRLYDKTSQTHGDHRMVCTPRYYAFEQQTEKKHYLQTDPGRPKKKT
jgi:hypothetical protein